MPVSSKIGSLFMVASCLGDFTVPFVIGAFIEQFPMVLIYVTAGATVACAVVFAALWRITSTIRATVVHAPSEPSTQEIVHKINEHHLVEIKEAK